MTDHREEKLIDVDGTPLHTNGPAGEAHSPANGVPAGSVQETCEEVGTDSGEASRWHKEAGRKGAQRIHQLIRQGKLYEEEHGLKRGRQRLRQLIEEGKIYEQEHGLQGPETGRRARSPRVKSDQVLLTFVHSLLRLAKPSVRARIAKMLQALESEGVRPEESLN